MEYGTAAVTAYLFEYSIATCSTRSLMTQFLTTMIRVAAPQLTTAGACTYVLCFESLIRMGTTSRVDRPVLPALRLSLACFPLARATPLSAFVSPTVQRYSAYPHAVRWLFNALMTDCGRGRASATTTDVDRLQTGWTLALMASLLACVSAAKYGSTGS
jgi:hypothetical protein